MQTCLEWLAISAPKSMRFRLAMAQGGRCYYCGVHFDYWPLFPTIDHKIPLVPRPGEPKGTNHRDNLVAACAPCNTFKTNRSDIGAGMLTGAWPASLITDIRRSRPISLVPLGWVWSETERFYVPEPVEECG